MAGIFTKRIWKPYARLNQKFWRPQIFPPKTFGLATPQSVKYGMREIISTREQF